MKLRNIDLSADYLFEKKDKDFYHKFYHNTSFIGYYMSKAIRKYHVETEEFRMIGVTLHDKKEGYSDKFVNDVLVVYIKFTDEDLARFKSLTDLTERCETYLSLLERGYRVAYDSGCTDVPLDCLLKINQQFREGGYKTEWLWKKKLMREDDMYLFFNAKYSPFDIRMEITVMDKKKTRVKCNGIIVRMMPYEEYFSKSFRKFVFMEDKIVILDFLDHPFCEIDLQLLKKDIVSVTILDENYMKMKGGQENLIESITW